LFSVSETSLAHNSVSGDIVVVQKPKDSTGGRGTLLSSSLEIEKSFTFDTSPSSGSRFQNAVVGSDPVSGNWLITWSQTGGASTTVLDAAGNEIAPAAVRLDRELRSIATTGDGTYWATSETGWLVHVSAAGEQLSSTSLLRANGNTYSAIAFGRNGPVTSGLVFGATTTVQRPTIAPIRVSWPGAEPVVPARLLETRQNTPDGTIDGRFAGDGARPADGVLELQVAGRGGVPNDATAALMNIAAVGSPSRGFVTAFPCDAGRPTSSNLNFESGGAASAAAFVTLSASGTACLYTSASVELVVDVNGFVPKVSSITPLVPGRLLETRSGTPEGTVDGEAAGVGRVSADGVVAVRVAGRAGVAGDAEAVLVNVTSINPTQRIFATVYACGSDRPTAANLNAAAGQNVNNLVLAEVGVDGEVCVYSSGPSDFVMDVSAFVPAGGGLAATLPARLVETRSGTPDGTIDGDFEGDGMLAVGVLEVDVAGRGPVPEDADGVMLNVAAISPATGGFMTLFPCDADRPTAANLNFAAGAVVSNAVFVELDDSGRLCVYSSAVSHLAIDVVGYVAD
jgi:hypothetical protein